MFPSKGYVGVLVLVGIGAAIVFGIPVIISVFVAPNIKRDFYGSFPTGLAELKSYVFEKSEPWDQNKQGMKYFGYKAPTAAELKDLKASMDLTRRYPNTLKGVFSPGPIPNTIELLYFSDELADLGVNTYWVIGEYRLNNNKALQFMPGFNQIGFPQVLSQSDAEKMLAWRLLLAKKAGFASILIPDFPDAFNVGRANFDIAKLKPEFERVALDLAKLAEEYQAEYFAPVNEYDHMLYSNGYSMDEIAKLEREFYDELTPKIRKIYRGRVVYKTGNIGDWSNFPKLSMKGADLFGVGNAYTGGAGETYKDEIAKAQAADLVSDRDSAPWFESEFLVYRPIDQQNWMGRIESSYPMDKTYMEGTSAFETAAKRAVGFTFMSWTGVGRIRGTAAGAVIKDFFTRWKPTPKLEPTVDLSALSLKPEDSFSLLGWLKNVPSYYSAAFKLATGQMGPQKDPGFGKGGPGGCKGKEECEAYCAKPENKDTCIRFGGKSDATGELGGPGKPGIVNDSERNGDPGSRNQGGPGGCKSDAECRAYCDQPQHQQECRQFRPRGQ